MTSNLDIGRTRLREARTAIFLETGNPTNTLEQEEALEAMSILIKETYNATGKGYPSGRKQNWLYRLLNRIIGGKI